MEATYLLYTIHNNNEGVIVEESNFTFKKQVSRILKIYILNKY